MKIVLLNCDMPKTNNNRKGFLLNFSGAIKTPPPTAFIITTHGA